MQGVPVNPSPNSKPVIQGFVTNYSDPVTNASYSNCWLNIRQINYCPNVSVLVVVDLYNSQKDFQDNMASIKQNIGSSVMYGDQNWTTYFDPSVMKQAGNDLVTQAMAYLQSIYPIVANLP